MKIPKDFVTSAFIVNDGKVLLVHHKIFDMWFPPGGHIEEGEEPTEAVLREIKEETGLDVELVGEEKNFDKVKVIKTPFVLQIEDIPHDNRRKEFHHHVDFIYLAKVIGGNLKHDPKESNDIKWFSKDELNNEKIDENTRYLVNKAISLLK